MNKWLKANGYSMFVILWIVVVVALLSSTATILLLQSGHTSANVQIVSGREAETAERFAKLNEIYDTLMENYYIEPDSDALLTGAIEGMLDAVQDPYTFYYTIDEKTAHDESDQGIFHGIGVVITLNADKLVEIISVYSDSPAETAGLQEGDIIMSVDGTEISTGKEDSLTNATTCIRGEDGTPVVLEILRGSETLEITAYRGEVQTPITAYSILDGDIGYLVISKFTGEAVQEVRSSIEEMQAAGIASLIVDVRDNPGGNLDVVVNIADMFLPEALIVYTEERTGNRSDYYSDADYWDIPMAVLTNGNSASASELFAAAIKENGRGTIVGETTFGKGIVQTLVSYSDNSGMQYTSARYFTPLGNCIHGIGVEPDISVAEGGDGEDAQLQTAMKLLRGE